MAYGSKTEQTGVEQRFEVGDIGFLVSDDGEGIDRMTLLPEPATLVGRDVQTLHGPLGSRNNVIERAHGLARVVSVDRDADTLRVVPVAKTKITAALQALGYPKLAS